MKKKSTTDRHGLCAERVLVIASIAKSLVNFRGELLCQLRDLGYEVHVAAPGLTNDSQVFKTLASWGVYPHEIPLSRTGMNPIKDLVLLGILHKMIRAISPTIFFAYTAKPVIYGSIAAMLAGVKSRYALVTGLGYAFISVDTYKRKLLNKCLRVMYRVSLRRVSHVFFQNADDLAHFRDKKLLPNNKPASVVNGSGVNIKDYSVQPLPRDHHSFLLIARLIGDKGIREFVQASRRLKSKYPGVSCRIVGMFDSNPDAISQEEIRQWEENCWIEFLGTLEDVRPAIADAEVFVLPSYREGTPRTVLEAMAMGRPIITTDVPGCRNTVVDGENGFLVPAKSVDALLEAMTRFVQNPELALSMGKKSRQFAVEKYDVHKVNKQILAEMGISDAI